MACNAHTVPLTTAEGDTISLRALVLKHVFFPLEAMLHPQVDVAHEEKEVRENLRAIDEARAMTAEACEAEAAREHRKIAQIYTELNQNHVATKARFVRARAMLEAWAVPTVLAEFKTRLLKELADDWPKPTDEPYPAPVRKTGEAWREAEIARHTRTPSPSTATGSTKAYASAEKHRRWTEALLAALPTDDGATVRGPPQ